jgi:hypothetical protein
LKVRAMFDERRSRVTAGIDKSYLLEPISVETKTKVSTTTKMQQQRQVVGSTGKSTRDQKMNYSKVIVPPLQNRYINNSHDINGNNHFNSTTTTDALERTQRSNDTALVNKIKSTTTTMTTKGLGTANGATKKPSPSSVTSSAPLKNVTNQKVGELLSGWRYALRATDTHSLQSRQAMEIILQFISLFQSRRSVLLPNNRSEKIISLSSLERKASRRRKSKKDNLFCGLF